MKKTIFIALVTLSFTFFVRAQGASATQIPPQATPATTAEKPKKQIFRADKDQILLAQKILREKNLYGGEASGKIDDALRVSIKSFQKDNGLRQTGTLNRATLEKMGIALTEKQKEIPVNPNSLASTDASPTAAKKSPVFRASKEQIMLAQKLLKDRGMYGGEQTGQLDEATREGLKKFQGASNLKATGTLNQATLEKMGIELTEKQKENSAKVSQK